MPRKRPVTAGGPSPAPPIQAPPPPPPNPERFIPSLPVDGRELMLAWEIPAEDFERMTVKTSRLKPASQELELLESTPLADWFLENVARKYGKGSYRIQAGPGPYRTKNTTIHVSQEYARDARFQAMPPMPPPPDPNQMMAARTAQQALAGPVEPLALAQMIQAAVDTALAKVQPATQQANPIDLLLKGMELANSSMLKNMETVKTMMGVQEPGAEKNRGWMDVAVELGPSILQTLQMAMKTAAPAAQPAQPHRPALADHAAPPPQPQPAQPIGEPMAFPPPPQDAIPILNVMKGQAFILKRYLEGPTPAAELAAQLDGLVGPDLEPSILAAADHVAEHGPAILGHADPSFASQKAAETLVAWARIIRSNEETMGGDQ